MNDLQGMLIDFVGQLKMIYAGVISRQQFITERERQRKREREGEREVAGGESISITTLSLAPSSFRLIALQTAFRVTPTATALGRPLMRSISAL